MLARFDYEAGAAMQFEVARSWIPAIGAGYHVGVDGIALPLLVLSLLLSLLCVVYSLRFLPEPGNLKAFLALLLLLETGMNGTFAALDLVLFFVFWETVLIPMYFLIAVWGGARREYASIKFILYTLIGSVVMLLGFLALWLRSSPEAAGRTFDILALQEAGRRPASAAPSAPSCSPPSPSASPSRCRSGRSTPGCPTPTPRPRRSARCCWPGSC